MRRFVINVAITSTKAVTFATCRAAVWICCYAIASNGSKIANSAVSSISSASKISYIFSENLACPQRVSGRRRYKANSSAQAVCTISKSCASKVATARDCSRSSRANLPRARASFATATNKKAINSAVTPMPKIGNRSKSNAKLR